MEEQRILAVLAHALGIFTSFIGALVILLLADETKPIAKEHAKEALNFQITVILANFISGILVIVGIGVLGLMAIYILNIVFCIMAAVAASNNQDYRYPVTIRFIS